MRPVSQETTKRNPSAASKIRGFNSLSVRKDGLYVPLGGNVNVGSNGDDGGDVNNDGGDGDKFVIAHDGDDVDRRFSPSLGGVLVIPLKDLMWATAILEHVSSIRVVRFCSISHFLSISSSNNEGSQLKSVFKCISKSSPQDGQLVRFPGEGVASRHLRTSPSLS